MARWAPERRDTIAAIADELLHNYGRGRVIVAVDGPDSPVTRAFADDLAAELRHRDHAAFVAALGDFQRARADRLATGEQLDELALRRALIDPFRLAGSTGFTLAAFDAVRDVPFETRFETAPADAVLLVEGTRLLRPALRGIWKWSLWLDAAAPPEGTDGEDPTMARYLADDAPRRRASAIVDVSDPEHPRRVFADSC